VCAGTLPGEAASLPGELDVRPVHHELRPALEEDDPLVVILEERDRLREPTAQDLLDRQRRQLGEDGEPLAFGGGSRGILQPSSTEAGAHGATLLDPLTD